MEDGMEGGRDGEWERKSVDTVTIGLVINLSTVVRRTESKQI